MKYIKNINGTMICTDVDRTILNCSDSVRNEKLLFQESILPQLVEVVKAGTQVAFITANGGKQLCKRLIIPILEYLGNSYQFQLLPRFHFFCNGAGTYYHIPEFPKECEKLPFERLRSMFLSSEGSLNEKYLVTEYAEITTLYHVFGEIEHYLKSAVNLASRTLLSKGIERIYKISNDSFSAGPSLFPLKTPTIQKRGVNFEGKCYIPQITLKPILSEFFFCPGIVEDYKDLRTEIIEFISNNLPNNLNQLSIKQGGRTSIDISLKTVNKLTAINYLKKRLNIKSSHIIYIGDEFYSGGNDFIVSEDPNLLCFAVRPVKKSESKKNIIVTNGRKVECQATSQVLKYFISTQYKNNYSQHQSPKIDYNQNKMHIVNSLITENLFVQSRF